MLKNRLVLSLQRKYSQKIISSSAQIKLPTTPIDQYVMEKWHRWEDKVAIECGVSGKKLTYKELRHRSNSLGVGLSQLGFKQKAALLSMPNCPDYPLAILGALRAGMTVSPASPLCSPDELKYLMGDAGVSCVLTTPDYLDNIQHAVESLEVAVMCTGPTTPEGVISFEQLSNIRDPYEELLPSPEDHLGQVALLPYSIGTTGLPKGVPLLHADVRANIEQISHHESFLSEITDNLQNEVPAMVPFTQIYGITILLLRSLRSGAKILCLPNFHPATTSQ